MPVTKEFIENNKNLNGDVYTYTITNSHGAYMQITNLGLAVMKLCVPDLNGSLVDVVLGFENPLDYLSNDDYLGVCVGRFANRIAKAKFNLNGIEYILAKNDGVNSCHGGFHAFHNTLWDTNISDEHTLEFKQSFEHMSEGFPGNLDVKITYCFDDYNTFTIEYFASTDMDTVLNLTNHSYFNLNGEADILSHVLKINAGKYTPTDETQIPLGYKESVADTPFDFREFHEIGERINENNPQLKLASGYDHNYCIDSHGYRYFASLYSEKTGINMDVYSDQPCVQLYCAQQMKKICGKHVYEKHSGVALETQGYPNAPNQPDFASCVLVPNKHFYKKTAYIFNII